ncbi:hypothetical protein MNBD_GAMMA19-1015 [hydrothermal vent metagenome]|uniref:Cytochrome c domain-containing protein n=1 Tax=hydrothermal vent metagenome TaxID=652676 RepID=A0A3B1AXW6_9ZZZZ
MKLAKRSFVIGVVLQSLMAASVFASGSYGGGANTHTLDDYSKGKIVVRNKVICSSCPFSGSSVNKDFALNVIEKIRAEDSTLISLSKDEQTSVVVYFRKRFKLE